MHAMLLRFASCMPVLILKVKDTIFLKQIFFYQITKLGVNVAFRLLTSGFKLLAEFSHCAKQCGLKGENMKKKKCIRMGITVLKNAI